MLHRTLVAVGSAKSAGKLPDSRLLSQYIVSSLSGSFQPEGMVPAGQAVQRSDGLVRQPGRTTTKRPEAAVLAREAWQPSQWQLPSPALVHLRCCLSQAPVIAAPGAAPTPRQAPSPPSPAG